MPILIILIESDLPEEKDMSAIYRIYNLRTDMTYLGKTDDSEGICASERFRLDLGMHACSSLQKDYTETGLELFVIEIIKECAHEELGTAFEKIKKEYSERGISFYLEG